MSRKEITRWTDTCMNFVYNDLGYTKEQIFKDLLFQRSNILKTIFTYQNCKMFII
mgnify:CR=1 FL=1